MSAPDWFRLLGQGHTRTQHSDAALPCAISFGMYLAANVVFFGLVLAGKIGVLV